MNVKRGLLGEGGLSLHTILKTPAGRGQFPPHLEKHHLGQFPTLRSPGTKGNVIYYFDEKEATFADFAAVLCIKAFSSKTPASIELFIYKR